MKTTTTAIVIRTTPENSLENLDVKKIGTETECEAFLFNILMPSESCRNLKTLPSNDGYCYQVERFYGNEWHTEIWHLLFYYDNNN